MSQTADEPHATRGVRVKDKVASTPHCIAFWPLTRSRDVKFCQVAVAVRFAVKKPVARRAADLVDSTVQLKRSNQSNQCA
jgi:hypothetical protein